LPVIKTLVEAGMLVVAAGGGGAPVYEHPTLGWEGVDAVVDKDLAAAVLARDLNASLLLILTDVDALYRDFGSPAQHEVRELSADEAEALLPELARGSMRPKLEASVAFVHETGGEVVVTSPSALEDALEGRAGTHIRP